MDIADRAIAPWWRQKFHGSSERRKSDELRDLIWSWCNIFRLDAFGINVWHVNAVSSANAIAIWGKILLWRGSVQNGRDLLQAQRKCVGAQPSKWSVPKMHLVCPHQACTIIISAYDMEHRKFAVFGQWANSCWSCSQVWDGKENGATSAYHVCTLQGRREKAVWQWSPLDSIQKQPSTEKSLNCRVLLTTINTGRLMWFFFAEAVTRRTCSSHKLHCCPSTIPEALWSLFVVASSLASVENSLRLWVKEDLDLMRVKTESKSIATAVEVKKTKTQSSTTVACGGWC